MQPAWGILGLATVVHGYVLLCPVYHVRIQQAHYALLYFDVMSESCCRVER
jgi:hypothetical protein